MKLSKEDIHRTRVRENARVKLRYNARFSYRYLRMFCSCVDCGERNPKVLEYDHVRGEKISGVSKLIYQRASVDKIKKEIRKCDVRCANCHVIKTHKFKYHY